MSFLIRVKAQITPVAISVIIKEITVYCEKVYDPIFDNQSLQAETKLMTPYITLECDKSFSENC